MSIVPFIARFVVIIRLCIYSELVVNWLFIILFICLEIIGWFVCVQWAGHLHFQLGSYTECCTGKEKVWTLKDMRNQPQERIVANGSPM